MLKLKTSKGDVEIKKKIKKKIRWDLTPEKAFSEGSFVFHLLLGTLLPLKKDLVKEEEEKAGYYFHVDVWNLKVRLYLMRNEADGEIRDVVGEVEGIPESYLLEAIAEAGGAINMSGRYPINAKIEKWLKERLSK